MDGTPAHAVRTVEHIAAQHRAVQVAQNALRKRDDQLLSTFHLEDGPATIEGIGLRALVIAARAAEMSASPNLALPTLTWLPGGIQNRVRKALQLPKRHHVVRSLFADLETKWKDVHCRAQGNKALRAKLEKLKVDKRGCNSAGLCFRGRMGLDSLHKRFIAESITRYCPPHSTGRSRLIHGETVGERSAARREFYASSRLLTSSGSNGCREMARSRNLKAIRELLLNWLQSRCCADCNLLTSLLGRARRPMQSIYFEL